MRYVFIVLCLTACAAERQPGDLFGSVEKRVNWWSTGCWWSISPYPNCSCGAPYLPAKPTAGKRQGWTMPECASSKGIKSLSTHPTRYTRPLFATTRGPQVEALTEYQLEVEVEEKNVRASTTTPDRMRVRQAVLLDEDTQEIMRTLKSFAEVGDEVYTAPENQLIHLEGLIELHLEKAERRTKRRSSP